MIYLESQDKKEYSVHQVSIEFLNFTAIFHLILKNIILG